MSIFCSIFQKVYHLEVQLPENADYISYYQALQKKTNCHDKISFLIYQFIIDFYMKTKEFSITQKEIRLIKLTKMKELYENMFFSKEDKNGILDIFSKTQKTLSAFSKLIRIYKMKKLPINIQTDLLLNPIDVRQKNVFMFLQNNAKYIFAVNDLINIITSNLSNCCFYFAEPLEIKNPYNNVPLSHAILYNLYFFIQKNLFSMPILFNLYFYSNFDMEIFKINNENYIREVFIKNYVFRSHYSILYAEVVTMIEQNMNSIMIDRDFPRETLVNIMRPYLQIYLLGNYLIFGCEKKYIMIHTLKMKLFQFSRYNPMFGRKIVRQQIIWNQCESSSPFVFRTPEYKNIIQFNTDCISFHNDEPYNFNDDISEYSDD